MDRRDQFPEWFKKEMEKRRWSYGDMAKAMDMSHSLVTQLANGGRNPSQKSCMRIAQAFEMSYEEVAWRAGLTDERPLELGEVAYVQEDQPSYSPGGEFKEIMELVFKLSPEERKTALAFIRFLRRDAGK